MIQDELDFACFAHSKCWGCSRAENGKECDALQTSYNWKFIKDGATGVNVEIACRKLLFQVLRLLVSVFERT